MVFSVLGFNGVSFQIGVGLTGFATFFQAVQGPEDPVFARGGMHQPKTAGHAETVATPGSQGELNPVDGSAAVQEGADGAPDGGVHGEIGNGLPNPLLGV